MHGLMTGTLPSKRDMAWVCFALREGLGPGEYPLGESGSKESPILIRGPELGRESEQVIRAKRVLTAKISLAVTPV